MIKKIIAILLLIVAVIGVMVLKNKKVSNSIVAEDIGTVTAEVQQAKVELPRLLDLGAGKCVPCKMMAPILEEMEKTFAGQLTVEFIDVWENKAEGDKYAIRMIPTQIFFAPDGKELFRHEGFFSREDMLKKWKELGFAIKDAAKD